MMKTTLIAAATFAALSTSAFAQTATDPAAATQPMMCDEAGMTKLKSEAESAKMEQRNAVNAAIGDATLAMQNNDMAACEAAMQKAKMHIDM